MTPILSILTPAIFSRVFEGLDFLEAQRGHVFYLAENIKDQIGTLPVEHLIVCDNRARSVGLKRQACLDIARGDYIAFVDDDDKIAPTYVEKILSAITETNADVITFDQRAVVNGEEAIVNFDISNADEPFTGTTGNQEPGTVKRNLWHVCVWKRELVKDCLFPDHSYGEDLEWSLQARARVKTHHHIDAVLHEYHHSSASTAAPPPGTTGNPEPGTGN